MSGKISKKEVVDWITAKPLSKKQILEKIKETGMGKETIGFCTNSNRWTILFFEPSQTCPYRCDGCQYDSCGYYEERKISNHLIRRLREFKWGVVF